MKRVLISGASGLIGEALVASFDQQGAEVVRLVRGASGGPGRVGWDPMHELGRGAVSGFDAVVHLAGESVVGRWTAEKMKAIRESRVRGTASVATALAGTAQKPRVFVCASAIGFYGDGGDEILTEESRNGSGFLPGVCREWEAASRAAADAGIRTVNVRIGLVLSTRGGALAKMLPAFKLGLGGRIASGKEWWSWIHIDDIVGAVHHAMTTESLSGPVNLVGPNAVRNEEFTKMLASVLARPAMFPVPAIALKAAFGGVAAKELFLASTRVEPRKLATSGYTFRFSQLRQALENLV